MNIPELYEEGQYYLSYLIRQQVYKNYPTLFEQLDFENDDHFNDPFLFGFFNKLHPAFSIEQILFHLLSENSCKAHAYQQVITLPKYGYLLLDTPPKESLTIEKNGDGIQIPTNVKHIAPYYLERHHTIEVSIYANSYYFRLCTDWSKEDISQTLNQMPQHISHYASAINTAFDILKKYAPEEYAMYLNSTKRIVLFEDPNLVSFVSRQMHGTIFLNVDEHSDVGFFIEELIHQCSHNVFNAVSAKIGDFLKVAPNVKISELTDRKGDNRGIYGAYHGVYTVSTGVHSLLKIVNADIDSTLKKELLGRLAIKKTRFRIGVDQVDMQQVFTPKGINLYQFLDERCAAEFGQYPDIFDAFDFSNQGRVFNFQKFETINKSTLNAML